MKRKLAPLIAAFLFAGSVSAQTVCKTVSGMSTETFVPASQAPNDVFGRTLGMFIGDFAGIAKVSLSSMLTLPLGFSYNQGASTLIPVRHVFLTGPGDTLITQGNMVLNPASATAPTQTNFVNSICPLAPCVVEAPQALTVIGGTGRWNGATGQINGLGIGSLNFPPERPLGGTPVGTGSFVYMVTGQICVPTS